MAALNEEEGAGFTIADLMDTLGFKNTLLSGLIPSGS